MIARKEAGLEDAQYLRVCLLFIVFGFLFPQKCKDTDTAVAAYLLRGENI